MPISTKRITPDLKNARPEELGEELLAEKMIAQAAAIIYTLMRQEASYAYFRSNWINQAVKPNQAGWDKYQEIIRHAGHCLEGRTAKAFAEAERAYTIWFRTLTVELQQAHVDAFRYYYYEARGKESFTAFRSDWPARIPADTPPWVACHLIDTHADTKPTSRTAYAWRLAQAHYSNFLLQRIPAELIEPREEMQPVQNALLNAFIHYYAKARSNESFSVLRSNWLCKIPQDMPLWEKCQLIECRARKKPRSRTANAWKLAQVYYQEFLENKVSQVTVAERRGKPPAEAMAVASSTLDQATGRTSAVSSFLHKTQSKSGLRQA